MPPLVGEAVKLTAEPEQIVVVDELTDTLAAKFGLTTTAPVTLLVTAPLPQPLVPVTTA